MFLFVLACGPPFPFLAVTQRQFSGYTKPLNNAKRGASVQFPCYTPHNVSLKEDAVSALTGFSLDHILSDLSLPSAGLSNRLGISGIPTLSSSQIYNDKWEDDGAVGAGEGEDFEDEVDRELKEEEEEEGPVKMEIMSPEAPLKQRRVRIVRRLVERPRTVYERFPSFEKNKVLDFTELFQGFAVKKSRVVKRPFQCTCPQIHPWSADVSSQWNRSIPRRGTFQRTSSTVSSAIQSDRWRMSASRK